MSSDSNSRLQSAIDDAAASFANDLIAILMASTVEELVGLTNKPTAATKKAPAPRPVPVVALAPVEAPEPAADDSEAIQTAQGALDDARHQQRGSRCSPAALGEGSSEAQAEEAGLAHLLGARLLGQDVRPQRPVQALLPAPHGGRREAVAVRQEEGREQHIGARGQDQDQEEGHQAPEGRAAGRGRLCWPDPAVGGVGEPAAVREG